MACLPGLQPAVKVRKTGALSCGQNLYPPMLAADSPTAPKVTKFAIPSGVLEHRLCPVQIFTYLEADCLLSDCPPAPVTPDSP